MTLQQTRSAAISAAAIVVVVSVTGCAAAVDRTGVSKPRAVVTLTALAPVGGREFKPFIDEVGKASQQTIAVKVEGDWHAADLGKEADAVAAVRQGSAPLAI